MAAQAALSDSNDSSICCVSNSETHSHDSSASASAANVTALSRLSENLESLFLSPVFDFCTDACIVVPASSATGSPREVPVHRCILSARSPSFRAIFSAAAANSTKIELKDLTKDFYVGFDSLVSVLAYLYCGKVKPLPEGVCCVDDDCLHVACRPFVDFMVEVLYAAFSFQIPELVTLYQRHLLDILDSVAIDDILVILSVASMCGRACERLLTKCIEIVASALVKSDIDIVTLEKALNQDVVKKITDMCTDLGLNGLEGVAFPDKHVRRIYGAFNSDDVELVRMLLNEGHTTLDDAYALHYVVAYCDPKITTELLDIGLADVNHKNPRGHSVLHVAAMRKEPKIIVSLLTKGARPSDLTLDGRTALQICKRLTKSVDYNRPTKKGMDTPKDRLCIQILEQEERNEPLLGEVSEFLATPGDDLRSRLLYFESRVSLAKILFPMEAKVAMDIAKVDRTSPSPLAANPKLTPGNQSMTMDSNDGPFKLEVEHLATARLSALSRTVEVGRRYFPRCSEVLNEIVDNDELSELANLDCGSLQERELKRQRFNEIQDIFAKAFIEDKENYRSTASAVSSSSTSISVQSRLTGK